MAKSKKDNLIHIKLEYEEALNGKRDVLTSEVSLLRISRRIQSYKAHRDNELDLKMLLYKKTKEVRANINLLHKILPVLQLPDVLKKHEEEYPGQRNIKGNAINTARPMHQANAGSDVESQLREIEQRLDELQNQR